MSAPIEPKSPDKALPEPSRRGRALSIQKLLSFRVRPLPLELFENPAELALRHMTWIQRWASLQTVLYDVLVISGWVATIFVLCGTIIKQYLPEDWKIGWEITLVVASFIAITCSMVASISRLKERALHGKKLANELQGDLLSYSTGMTSKEEFVIALRRYLEEEYKEDKP